jgi:hypothetical protein
VVAVISKKRRSAFLLLFLALRQVLAKNEKW